MINMLKRLPNSQAVLQVYAVIAVMLSGWTMTAFLWKLSTWLLTLNIGEILAVFSYAMFTNLVESLIVLLLLLLLCFLLPPHVLRDHFVIRGAILSIGFIGALMVFLGVYRQFGMANSARLLIGPLAVLLVTVSLLALSSKFRFVRSVHSAVLWISDRLVVFLFILIPLYILLSAHVIFRNIAGSRF